MYGFISRVTKCYLLNLISMKKFSSVLLMLVSSFYVQAADYYISSSSGSDQNAGTSPATAFKTITKLNSVFTSLNAGDHIYLKRGDLFYGEIKATRSGTTSAPIFIDAYGIGNNPVITGLSSVDNWTQISSNTWESTQPASPLASCNLVVMNGINTPAGRFPAEGYLTIQDHAAGSVTVNGINGSVDWTGATLVIRKNRYLMANELVTSTSYNGQSCTLTYSGNNNYSNGWGVFIQNDSHTLTMQNEWYFDPTTKKLCVYSNSKPANVKLTTLLTLFDCTQQSYIQVQNIDFSGADTALMYSHYKSDNIVIKNCHLSFSGADGIYFPNSSNMLDIENNTVMYCSHTGIFSGDSKAIGTVIKNNTVSNIGVYPGQIKGQMYGAITSYPDNALIQYNNIDSCGYNGIWFKGNNTKVVNNYIKNFCINIDDGSGIYTTYDDNNRQIIGNIIINGIGNGNGTSKPADKFVMGIYLDDGCSNVEVINNSIAYIGQAGIFLHSAHDNLIRGNTIFDAKGLGYVQGAISIQKDNNTHLPVKNDTIWNNTLVALQPGALCFYYSSNIGDSSDYKAMGSLDSNLYIKPANVTGSAIKLLQNIAPFHSNNYSEESWKRYTQMEGHTVRRSTGVADASNLKFEYNPTNKPLTISIPSGYNNVKGDIYNGSVTLQPYTSIVLVKS